MGNPENLVYSSVSLKILVGQTVNRGGPEGFSAFLPGETE
jgi:hypothetical protein